MVIDSVTADSTDIIIIISKSDKGVCETVFIHDASTAIIDGIIIIIIIIIIITIITELEMNIILWDKEFKTPGLWSRLFC